MSTVYQYIQIRSPYFTDLNVSSIIFDSDFITGNVITMDISSINIGNINFLTDHDTTIGLIVTAIDNLAGVNAGLSPNDSSNRTIDVYGLTNTLIAIDNVSVTGGANQTGYTIMDSRLPELIAQATLKVGCSFESKEMTNNAIALIVMHWLALEESSGVGIGGSAASGGIKSKKEGDLSISYSSSNNKFSSSDAYWAATFYGMEYLNLQRTCVFAARNRMVSICQ